MRMQYIDMYSDIIKIYFLWVKPMNNADANYMAVVILEL